MIRYDELKSPAARSIVAAIDAEYDKKQARSAQVVIRDDGTADLSGRQAAIDAAKILDFIHAILSYYARWEKPEWIDVTTLWIAHTWFADLAGELRFASTPRWLVVACSGCGKSRLLELIAALSRNPTGLVSSDVTAPGVRNALAAGMTVILDEFHRTVGTGRAKEALQSVITGGYRRSGASLNGTGGISHKTNFGPVALGAQPRLVTGTQDMLQDLFNRSFIILPQQASADEIADLDATFELRAMYASQAMKQWAAQERTGERLWPVHTMPGALSARNREICQALLAVADRAVDPAAVQAQGNDLRWAIRARDAVQAVLLGSGHPEIVMANITEQYKLLTAKEEK